MNFFTALNALFDAIFNWFVFVFDRIGDGLEDLLDSFGIDD